jgi:hypothetical protein
MILKNPIKREYENRERKDKGLEAVVKKIVISRRDDKENTRKNTEEKKGETSTTRTVPFR